MNFCCLQISQKANQIFDFCSSFTGQKSVKNLVGFLGDLKTLKFYSEINWPLRVTLIASPIKCGRQFLKFKQIKLSIFAEFFLDVSKSTMESCNHGGYILYDNILLLRGNSFIWKKKLYFFKSTFKNLFPNSVLILFENSLLYCKSKDFCTAKKINDPFFDPNIIYRNGQRKKTIGIKQKDAVGGVN